jgi:signal transduction histidine kinase
VGLVLGGLVLLLALRRALRPVHDLATAARSVDLGDLSSRVPEPASRDEVAAMAQEFNRMLDRIRDDERHRRQLLSAISHELRTPLAVAGGHLELLETLGPSDGYSARETAAVVRRELDRLARIVDDLTAINRGESGAPILPEPVFAPDVTDALGHRLAGLGYDDVEIRDVPPVVLLGNEDRITQALLNLVVNARTHTPPGTPVRVAASADSETITFSVQDQGPGIDPSIRDHVFDPFVTTKSDGSGRTSGLGLSVVKAIVEALGGRVRLSTGAAGTEVSLVLPLDREPAEPDGLDGLDGLDDDSDQDASAEPESESESASERDAARTSGQHG